MDDGKRKNFELTGSIIVLIGLFLLVAPANGTPRKEGANASRRKFWARTRNRWWLPQARP